MENQPTPIKKLQWKHNSWLFGFGTSPEADWRIILISAMILVVLIITLSVFIFIKIDKGEIFVVERLAEQSEKTLNLSLLKETVSYYEAKDLELGKIKNATTVATDPSL